MLVMLFMSCVSEKRAENRRYARTDNAAFVQIGKDKYLVILNPALIARLFGGNWYTQEIFVDHSHYFMGQPGPPILLWKTDGLVFEVDKKRLITNKPYWIAFYSLDRKLFYELNVQPELKQVTVLPARHGPPGEEPVYNGYLKNGFHVQ